MNFLLDATTNPETYAEKLVYGGQVVFIGMLTVFLVLTILWLSLELLHYLLHRGDKTKAKKEADAVAAPAPVTTVAPAGDEDEIAAVIAAAIYAAEESAPQSKFRAVSFKRIH